MSNVADPQEHAAPNPGGATIRKLGITNSSRTGHRVEVEEVTYPDIVRRVRFPLYRHDERVRHLDLTWELVRDLANLLRSVVKDSPR